MAADELSKEQSGLDEAACYELFASADKLKPPTEEAKPLIEKQLQALAAAAAKYGGVAPSLLATTTSSKGVNDGRDEEVVVSGRRFPALTNADGKIGQERSYGRSEERQKARKAGHHHGSADGGINAIGTIFT